MEAERHPGRQAQEGDGGANRDGMDGQTTWVSEDDFVNGGMAKASDNELPDAYAVHLPQD